MKAWLGVLALSAAVLFPGLETASAQTESLTPEQRRMLDALPPAQRQQALEALRGVGGAGQQASGTSTIREVDDAPDRSRSDSTEQDVATEPRAREGSNVVLTFSPKESLEPSEIDALEGDQRRSRFLGSSHFTLDGFGALSIEGLEAIPLLGLSESDIERRLAAEPLFAAFDIDVRILATEATGRAALMPFGYELFRPEATPMTPPQAGPVPADYVLGPGDTVRVQLFGNVNAVYEFEVSRDGILTIPQIGPVTVAGIPFSEFRRDLNEKVRGMLIGTDVSVTMGPLRTIRVFVLGDVSRPGSYVVSGLASMSSALYRSGGISEVGSLRNVQLKRNGQVVTTLDLYDLLLNGDNSADRRLQPGDVVFVPPIGPTVSVSGAVRRPAIYETKGAASVADVVRLAGGLSPEAFPAGASLERIVEGRDRRVIAVDLSTPAVGSIAVASGDHLRIPEVLPEFEDDVNLMGHVHRPGSYQWFPGMRLTDLITSPFDLKPGVDDGYVLVRRERVRGDPVDVLSADLGAALRDSDSKENIELDSRDTVFVFSLSHGRQRIVEQLLAELELHATFEEPFQKVEVVGDVRAPGVYPLEPGMRVSDLIRAGGELTERAFTVRAELTRYTAENAASREIDIIEVDLERVLGGDTIADIELRPHDHLSITRIPEWESSWTVRLDGEITFSGEYRIRRGETLASVLERAGGLTPAAFPEGAVFLRQSLRERERDQIEVLARRLESDLTSLSLQTLDTTGAQTLATGQTLLEQLRNYEPVGRLVIDIADVKSAHDDDGDAIELRDGDRLIVPQRSQVVTVIGETQQNTSHLYHESLSRDDYIELSGGLTRRADKRLIYVVRANGSVVMGARSRWLGSGRRTDIEPGDTIVVPLATDRVRPLTFWTNVTQIIYQGAIAIAAIRSFEN